MDHAHTGLDELDMSTHPARDAAHFRRMIAARESLTAAEQGLRGAVKAAREAGDSWTVIGAALDTTRRAARRGVFLPTTPEPCRRAAVVR